MTMKVVWQLSSKLMCNRLHKVELTKQGVEELSCWTKKMVKQTKWDENELARQGALELECQDESEPENQDEYLKMNEMMNEKMVDEKMKSIQKLQLQLNEDEEMRSRKKNLLWDETRLIRL